MKLALPEGWSRTSTQFGAQDCNDHPGQTLDSLHRRTTQEETETSRGDILRRASWSCPRDAMPADQVWWVAQRCWRLVDE